MKDNNEKILDKNNNTNNLVSDNSQPSKPSKLSNKH